MQTANAIVYLDGDKGQSVYVSGITCSELAVLRVIHGEDAVQDIEPGGDVKISDRAERARLIEKYGQRKPDSETGERVAAAVDLLFPGVASRLFNSLEELDLPEHFFKPRTRETAVPVNRNADPKAEAEPILAEAGPEAEEDDGIRDMPKKRGQSIFKG